MVTNWECSRAFYRGRLPCLLRMVLVLLLSLSLMPNATAKEFSVTSIATGKDILRLDTEFVLLVTMQRHGSVVHFVELTEKDVTDLNFLQSYQSNLVVFDLIFKDTFTQKKGILSYWFSKDDSINTVSLTKYFVLEPDILHPQMNSTYRKISFKEPNDFTEPLGDPKMVYDCDKVTATIFEKASDWEDVYTYNVKLITTKFRAQAFNMEDGKFSSTSSVCSPQSDFYSEFIVSAVAILIGVLVFVFLSGVCVVILVRRSRPVQDRSVPAPRDLHVAVTGV